MKRILTIIKLKYIFIYQKIRKNKVAKSFYRKTRKEGTKCFQKIRSIIKNKDFPYDNIYYATIQKTGSQWLKRIFSDYEIRRITGLTTYPQHHYDLDEFQKVFPRNTFVPCLYIDYSLYEEIIKPISYRTFYVLRDPRDIIISWYYSTLRTHDLMKKIGTYRKELEDRNFEDGISFCIDILNSKFCQQRSWVIGARNDKNVLIIKYEELVLKQWESFKKLFDWCGINITDKILDSLLKKYSFKNLREEDIRWRGGIWSHYRKGEINQWKKELSKENLKKFYDNTGNLIEVLGYKF